MSERLKNMIVDALATEIETAFSDAGVTMPVSRGFAVEGDGDDRMEFARPMVTLQGGEVQTENVGGSQYTECEDVDADTVRVTWRRAYATLPIQLDFYTENKTQRHTLAETLERLFYPFDEDTGAPLPEGLVVTLAEAFDARCRIVLESTATRDDEGADQGYARAIWQLEAQTAKLEQTEHTKITRDVEVVEI